MFQAEYKISKRLWSILIIASKLPEKVEFVWQGEIYSEGSSHDISCLAKPFIDELFRHFGQTITNKKFIKRTQ